MPSVVYNVDGRATVLEDETEFRVTSPDLSFDAQFLAEWRKNSLYFIAIGALLVLVLVLCLCFCARAFCCSDDDEDDDDDFRGVRRRHDSRVRRRGRRDELEDDREDEREDERPRRSRRSRRTENDRSDKSEYASSWDLVAQACRAGRLVLKDAEDAAVDKTMPRRARLEEDQ